MGYKGWGAIQPATKHTSMEQVLGRDPRRTDPPPGLGRSVLVSGKRQHVFAAHPGGAWNTATCSHALVYVRSQAQENVTGSFPLNGE
jgi:hypothetical protein